MKRILFMHQTSSIGGGSYCLLNIIKALDRQLYEPVVTLQSEGALAIELRKMDVEVVIFHQMAAVPYNRSLWNYGCVKAYFRVCRSLIPFAELLKEVKCDVLYLNNMMIYPYLKVAKEQGVSTVLHVREHWPLDEHKVQLNWARKAVYAYADRLIAINQYSANIFPDKESTIVYDWIDMKGRYKPMPLNEIFGENLEGKKVYLFTGGMNYIKGGLVIANLFKENNNDQNSRLLMLGVENTIKYEGLFGLLRKVLALFGIEMRSDQLRRLIKKDKRIVCWPAIYELSHIIQQSYCILSYFTIPHANLVMAESLILGTPVIAANTEEACEYSQGLIPELLFPINDKLSYLQSISTLDNKYLEIKRRIVENSSKISFMFSEERNARLLVEVLQEL